MAVILMSAGPSDGCSPDLSRVREAHETQKSVG